MKLFESLENNNISGIYMIINLMNNKIYIGSAVNIRTRINLHRCQLKNNKHSSKYLQRSYDKYEENNFIVKIIENVDKENLISREQYYINLLNPEYNSRKIANSQLGFKHSNETKLKFKNRMLNIDEIYREKLRVSRNKIIQKAFNQYDKNMNFIKHWNNLQEYFQFIGKRNANVSTVLSGKRKTTNGFIFKYN